MSRFIFILAISLFVPGCTGSTSSSPGETGVSIYQKERCRRCHAIGGKGGGTGPALDTVGARRGREWLEAYLTDPTSKIPKSRMADPELTGGEIRLLVDYLMGL
jgi:cbb3-type cytochrome oxidase cytochrome c subunit